MKHVKIVYVNLQCRKISLPSDTFNVLCTLLWQHVWTKFGYIQAINVKFIDVYIQFYYIALITVVGRMHILLVSNLSVCMVGARCL